ncbi:MAG: Maf family protein [Mariprofundaceae bacterium]
MPDEARPLILASTSPYRRELLQRLRIPFEQKRPEFSEIYDASMSAEELVRHNTLGKGRSMLGKFPDAAIIASDQLAVCNGNILGKPGSAEKARLQLRKLSGCKVSFLTGVALLTSASEQYAMVPCHVYFRELTDAEIATYVKLENPVDCAGSFKSEALGITLLERLEGDDPTALIGLPLIQLSSWLKPLQQDQDAMIYL